MASRMWNQWWAQRQHPPASASHLLGWHNLYVWPTGAGWLLLLVWCVLMLLSINYQLNLGYLLGFLLAGSVLASIWLGHANLRGLQLQILPIAPAFAGHPLSLQLQIAPSHASKQARRAVLVAARAMHDPAPSWVCVDVLPHSQAECTLGIATAHRGQIDVPVITVHSLYPLGVFRLWSHWQPLQKAWVYPAPIPMQALQPAETTGHAAHAPASTGQSSEPEGVRLYQRGDALRHIVWRKAAQALAQGRNELITRDFPSGSSPTVWLDERSIAAHDREARLSQLCAWVLETQTQAHAWGLRLHTGETIAPAQGDAHLHHCLQLLAQQPLPHGQRPA